MKSLVIALLLFAARAGAQQFFPAALETIPYPPLATQAHVSGQVELTVTVGADGALNQVHAISGHPLLREAAQDGIRKWRFSQRACAAGSAQGGEFELKVHFSVEGEAKANPQTRLKYTFPDLVEVLGEAPAVPRREPPPDPYE
jgi:TonB family protein